MQETRPTGKTAVPPNTGRVVSACGGTTKSVDAMGVIEMGLREIVQRQGFIQP
jgi:hypothetical protein